ncbi:MAG: shikimate dehydrogenase [Candidatus Omnitrophica bacterium]|nr:shikimate dehydrogenase [Candidatus Omnitrophota bacterium]
MINKVGFIGHPIDLEHLYKMLGPWAFFARKIAPYQLNAMLKNIPPYRLVSVKNIRSAKNALIDCHTIICPLMPTAMVSLDEEFVLKKITQAVKVAERLGAKIVTLGGFTSVVGNEGETVSKRVGVPITSGNTYTAALAIEGILKAAYYMEIDLARATLAVIGATGDIGSICTKVLSKKMQKLNIVARNEERMNVLMREVQHDGRVQVETFKYYKDAVKNADIILAVTSAVSTIIEPENLKPGSIVCDVAIPANIAKEVVNVRNDVFVFEGGLAKLPYQHEIKDRVFNELMPSGSIYGCLAEGMVLAFDGKFENYSIGRGNITEEKINEISKIARKHGLHLADFFCGYRFYSEDDMESIKRNAKRNILSGKFVKR